MKNTVILGKMEGSRERERPNMKWIDSIKEATHISLQELSRAVRTGHCGCHLFIGLPEKESTPQHVTHTHTYKDKIIFITIRRYLSCPEFACTK